MVSRDSSRVSGDTAEEAQRRVSCRLKAARGVLSHTAWTVSCSSVSRSWAALSFRALRAWWCRPPRACSSYSETAFAVPYSSDARWRSFLELPAPPWH